MPAVLRAATLSRCGDALLRRFTLPIVCWCLGLGVAPSHGQEWTRFRGPNGSGIGVAPNLPAVFSEKDFNWNVELPGSGHSSPVLWGGRIFVTATPKGSTKRLIVCLNVADGKESWRREYETAAYHLHTDNNYSAATPAVDGERVYLHWASPQGSGLVALDQKDGKELWRKELGPYVSQHGPGASPIIYQDLVLLNFDHDEPGSFLFAFDAKTGAERWKFAHAGTSASASTPCVFESAGNAAQVILISRTTGMTAVNAQAGKLEWALPDLMSKRCIASPIVTPAGLLIGQCGEGRSESFVYAVRRAPPRSRRKDCMKSSALAAMCRRRSRWGICCFYGRRTAW